MLWQIPGPTPGAGINAAGSPLTRKRVEGISHLIVTHGCGLVPLGAGTWKGQPATVARGTGGGEIVATGWPFTTTRGCVGGIVAVPAW